MKKILTRLAGGGNVWSGLAFMLRKRCLKDANPGSEHALSASSSAMCKLPGNVAKTGVGLAGNSGDSSLHGQNGNQEVGRQEGLRSVCLRADGSGGYQEI